MITPSKASRRPLKFKTVAELDAELQQLRTGKYTKAGNWSLPQACKHLAATIEGSLSPAASDVPTPEESAMKQKFFAMVLGDDGFPSNMPIGNPALIPSEDCSEKEIEGLQAAFEKLMNLPHKFVKVGRCGPVSVMELVPLHLAHAAHHLSYLIPVTD